MDVMINQTANKILAINLDSDILDILIKGLQGEVSLSFASDGTNALEMVKMNKPDLILLNVVMPDMSGFDVCQNLKNDPEIKHIPFVFLSRISDGKSIARGLELGANDYITEPFDPEVILAKVRNFLRLITDSRALNEPEESTPILEGPAPQSRTETASIPDRYAETEVKSKGMSLTKFMIIAFFIMTLTGGGYAWFVNSPASVLDRFVGADYTWLLNTPAKVLNRISALVDQARDTVFKTEPVEQTPASDEPAKEEDLAEEDLAEEDIPILIAEDDERPPKDPQFHETADQPAEEQITPPTIEPSEESCGDIPKVPWWGNVSHDSITAYVNNKNDGDWDGYISKWERQLSKLRDIQSRGAAVITPILGTRMYGPALSKYISKFERRLEVNRCLAAKTTGQ